MPAFADEGYLVEEQRFPGAELDRLHHAVEQVSVEVTARARRPGAGPEHRLADGHRIQFSSRAGIQWEWADGSQAIRLIEPCDHLHPALGALFDDERLLDPVRRELGRSDVAPFTSKLNFKRAAEGSQFPWHQDYPYWYVAVGRQAADVVTAVVFLDDATAGNGALQVLPGSHRAGPVRRDPCDPTGFLADPAAIDAGGERTLEVPAGSVVWFGAFLVHRSSPNTSARHRRAVLLSWQPGGRPRLNEVPYRPERVAELP